MRILAISDLHLSFKQSHRLGDDWEKMQYKPMSVLDDKWQNHARHIYDNWHRTVQQEDVVLMPGDISWAMRLPEAKYDLEFLGSLPGTILAITGNHDYWWQSLKKAREAAPENLRLLQNDAIRIGDLAICGSRGWLCPNGVFFTEADQKIYKRELLRLESSLQAALKSSPKDILVMTHYMPTNEKHEYSGFIELLEKYQVKRVIYGHLHGKARHYCLPSTKWGIGFTLVSADYLDFTPRLLQLLEP